MTDDTKINIVDMEEGYPLFTPSLMDLLIEAEQAKQSPLTEEEVLDILDNAQVTLVSLVELEMAEAERGYVDLDPEYVWEEWQDVINDADNFDETDDMPEDDDEEEHLVH